MLATQVSYWNLQETKRHNIAAESQARNELTETQRHNRRTEELQGWSIGETSRHNKAMEGETYRHNQAVESQAWASLSELQRHNRQGEMQAYWNYLSDMGYKQSSVRQRESELDIRGQEAKTKQYQADEAARHNKESEMLGWAQYEWSKKNDKNRLIYDYWDSGSNNFTKLVGDGLRGFTNIFSKRGFGGGTR